MSHLGTYRNAAIWGQYQVWDSANPQVYPKFVHLVQRLIARGHKQLSAKLIFEGLRLDHMLQTTGDFKLNNNFTAIYARRFMDDFPEHGDLFKLRTVH